MWYSCLWIHKFHVKFRDVAKVLANSAVTLKLQVTGHRKQGEYDNLIGRTKGSKVQLYQCILPTQKESRSETVLVSRSSVVSLHAPPISRTSSFVSMNLCYNTIGASIGIYNGQKKKEAKTASNIMTRRQSNLPSQLAISELYGARTPL